MAKGRKVNSFSSGMRTKGNRRLTWGKLRGTQWKILWPKSWGDLYEQWTAKKWVPDKICMSIYLIPSILRLELCVHAAAAIPSKILMKISPFLQNWVFNLSTKNGAEGGGLGVGGSNYMGMKHTTLSQTSRRGPTSTD